MPKKGKEPPGLRRYRLAQKRKKMARKPQTSKKKARKTKVRTMARRGRKSRKSGKPAIPLLMTLPVVIPAVKSYQAVGMTAALPEYMLWQTTGYSASEGKFNKDLVIRQVGLTVAGMVGHKVANRLGINKHLKRMTMGYFNL